MVGSIALSAVHPHPLHPSNLVLGFRVLLPPNPPSKGGSRRDPPPMLLHKNMSQVLSTSSVTLLLQRGPRSLPPLKGRKAYASNYMHRNKQPTPVCPGSLLSRSGCSFFSPARVAWLSSVWIIDIMQHSHLDVCSWRARHAPWQARRPARDLPS